MMPRIFSAAPLAPDATANITGTAAAHIARVLRLRPGDDVVLFDGAGLQFPARIESVSARSVDLVTGSAHDPGTESTLPVTLLQGICRNPRMDLVIQKATELGVSAIVPLQCARSVVRLDAARARKRSAHWREVAISACEQSGRVRVPDIHTPQPLDVALADDGLMDVECLLLDPTASTGIATPAATRVALLIGPEGGLTDNERAVAHAAGFRSVRLGPRVLRTETAPLAAISILQYLGGDLR